MYHVMDKLRPLVAEELEAANQEHPLFASAHEGYAVLLEEVEEAKDEMMYVDQLMKPLWTEIKSNMYTHVITSRAEQIKRYAIDLAAEAIQVAAMAQKMIDSLEK